MLSEQFLEIHHIEFDSKETEAYLKRMEKAFYAMINRFNNEQCCEALKWEQFQEFTE